jgi:hypothetical protein
MGKAPGAARPSPAGSTLPKRAFGRSLGDFPKLGAAEKRLVACCARGEVCELGDGTRPEKATAANTIRAGLIRFLALGGDAENPVHDEGVMLRGGWIEGELSLHQVQAEVRLDLRRCHFDTKLNFIALSLPELVLSGSLVSGIRADRMKVDGGVFMDEGFAGTGEVCLSGVQIGGNLDCSGGSFFNPVNNALSADRMTVAGSVFLNNGFAAVGEVRLLGARIGGSLTCTTGNFSNVGKDALCVDGMTVVGSVFLNNGFAANGEVRLLGAQIGGNLVGIKGSFTKEGGNSLSADGMKLTGSVFLSGGFAATGVVRLVGAQIGAILSCSGGSFTNAGGKVLNADGMTVVGGVFLRRAAIDGAINLTASKIGTLVDDAESWQLGGHIFDGLRYDRIIGPTDAAMRIGWLKTQYPAHLTTDFAPQPWEQLIKVLREMGHPDEAAKVAMAKQDQLRIANAPKERTLGERFKRALHWVYGKGVGYGHRPIWTVYWMAGICAVFSLAFYAGDQLGYFGPTNPLIHASAAFEACGAPGEGKVFWTSAACPTPPEYTTFQPILYSLDLILPLVDLHQEADWGPIVLLNGKTLWLGWILRGMMWAEILFGWVASLTLVAVLGRLVDKD